MRLAALFVVSAGCTVLADFPADRLEETTASLCANGVDDDLDGLSDCSDFGCLGLAVCCDTPTVVIEDAFEGSACAAASCDDEDRACAPDPERWLPWGVPDPFLCEDALAIHKDVAVCYPVGVLSKATVRLRPGLRIEASVSGQPEQVGHLEIALTRQATVTSGTEVCAAIAPVPTMLGMIYAAAPGGGVRYIATIAGAPIAERSFPDARARKVGMWIDDDLALHFEVQGGDLVTIRDVVPADAAFDAHLVVSGRGVAARLEHVRVLEGTRCDAPGAWAPPVNASQLPEPGAGGWDAFERRTPSATLDDDNRVHLRYLGCAPDPGNPTCLDISLAIGEAVAPPQAGFSIPEVLVSTDQIVQEGFAILDVAAIEADRLLYYGLDDYEQDDVGADRLQRCAIVPGDEQAMHDSVERILEPAEDSPWDARHVCCPSVVVRDDEHWLYYAGRAEDDARWQIGLAVSTAGGAFERRGVVLSPAEDGASVSVSQPWVIFDDERELFRMWYRAIDSLGTPSIHYAVSPDGLAWHPFPGNPVIEAGLLGLDAIGSPTVVDDGGRLRMWIHGRAPGAVARTIYELENVGGDPP